RRCDDDGVMTTMAQSPQWCDDNAGRIFVEMLNRSSANFSGALCNRGSATPYQSTDVDNDIRDERSDPHDPQAYRRTCRHRSGRHCCARFERGQRYLARLWLVWPQLLLQLSGLHLSAGLLRLQTALRLSALLPSLEA